MIRQPEFFQTMGIAESNLSEKRLTTNAKRCKIIRVKAKASLSFK